MLVISEFAPLAAAPKFVRAPPAVVEPVPPWPTLRAVVRPVRLVMSELAPVAAAPRLVRAPAAEVDPVPPLPTLSALLSVRLANVGVEVVAMPWMVLMTPALSVKFVLLKAAIPLVLPSALASSIVMVPSEPLELANRWRAA
jgi:hypothetical protein